MSDTVHINEEDIPVRAYLHRKSDTCVTTDPTAYENPRKLVAWEDIADHVEWLEKGIREWRDAAQRATRKLEERALKDLEGES